jgi:hypothetical protein
MTTNVYRHKVRLITDQMLNRAIVLGIERDGIKDLERLYRFDDSVQFFDNYRKWDDARFMVRFGEDGPDKSLCRELVLRLEKRRLFKRVFSEKIRDFANPSAREVLLDLSKPINERLRQELEGAVAKIITTGSGAPIEPRMVIIHAFDIKSVRTTSRNDAELLVATAPEPRPFEQYSTLFMSINEQYTDSFVEVYAPVNWENPAARKKLCDKVRNPIRELFENLGQPNKLGVPNGR